MALLVLGGSRVGGRGCACGLIRSGDYWVYRSRVLALFLWRRIAVRLLPRRYIDNRFSELVGVPRAFGGHCHGLNSPDINLSPSVSVAVRVDANSLILRSDGYRSLILAPASTPVDHPFPYPPRPS